MPETIVLEDGTTREVPTSEELQALQAKAEEATQIATLKEELAAKTKEFEEATPEAIKNMRQAIKTLKSHLNAKGIEVDENNVPIEKPNVPSQEELTRQMKQTAQQTLVESKLSDLLSTHDKDTKEVIQKYLEKLTVGESVNLQNVAEFYKAAASAAGVQSASHPAHQFENVGSYGAGPITASKDSQTLAKGAELAKSLGYSFRNDPNKLINK